MGRFHDTKRVVIAEMIQGHLRDRTKDLGALKRWLTSYRRLRETADCIHGHFDCSTVPGGPCSDEVLARADELAREAVARELEAETS